VLFIVELGLINYFDDDFDRLDIYDSFLF